MIKPSEAHALMKPEIKCQECDGEGKIQAFETEPDEYICASCSGKGVIIEDVIMMIIGELWQSWKSYESEPLVDEIPHLTKALLLLLALADVKNIKIDNWELSSANKPESITESLRLAIRATNSQHILMAILLIYHICKLQSIDIESHIKAYQENFK